jgi:hypothetical protein
MLKAAAKPPTIQYRGHRLSARYENRHGQIVRKSKAIQFEIDAMSN